MFTTVSLQVKLIAIAIVLVVASGTGAYVAWNIRAEMAHREAEDAVANARKDWDVALKAKDALIDTYRGKSDEQYAALLKGISSIKVTNTTITKNVQGTVEKYPVFYVQPLPQEGYKQWLEARKLLQ